MKDSIEVVIRINGKKYAGYLPLKGSNEHLAANIKYAIIHTLEKVRPQ